MASVSARVPACVSHVYGGRFPILQHALRPWPSPLRALPKLPYPGDEAALCLR